MSKVSVIIPTHNRARLVGAAVKSVLNQIFQDFEIVIVDDASQDNTPDVVAGFEDSRIRYIRNATSQGDAGARNAGIRSSTAPYVAFLDDDDEWMPEKLGQQIEKFEQSPKEVGAVYAGCVVVDEVSGKVLNLVLPEKSGDLRDEIFVKNHITTSSVVIRRECFDQMGLFDESIPHCSDYDMWIRISEQFHFECIRTPLVRYRVHQNKLSTNFGMMIRGQEILLQKYGPLLARNRKTYSKIHLSLATLHFEASNPSRARQAFLKALRIYPFEIRNYFYFLLSCLGLRNYRRVLAMKQRILTSLIPPIDRPAQD